VKFIQVFRWVNTIQQYLCAGNLIKDAESRVSFHYDEEYLVKAPASLDPKNLNLKTQKVFTTLDGKLPAFFTHFLPGQYASTVLSDIHAPWDSLDEFDKLSFISEYFGDHGAIQLNAHDDRQQNSIGHGEEDMERIVEAIQTFQSENHRVVFDKPSLSICGVQGTRPMFEFAEPETGTRFFGKPSCNPKYNETSIRLATNLLSHKAQIDTVKTAIKSFGEQDIAVQQNFKHAFFKGEDTNHVIKFNAVPFDILIDNERTPTYEDIARVIKQYSDQPETDLSQLHLRAIFDASINSTRNELDNFHMIDLGVNKWRLAPSFASLPNPDTSAKFSTPFSYRHASRALFTPDALFSAYLGNTIGLNNTIIEHNYALLQNTLNNLEETFADANLPSSLTEFLSWFFSFNCAYATVMLANLRLPTW